VKTYDERTADVSARIMMKRKQKKVISGVCLTLAVVILAAALFVPYRTTPPSVTAYANSPYYDLIQKINVATFQKPRYKNNFDALMSNVLRFNASGGAVMDGAVNMPEASPDMENGEYVEVTDNQVSGIIEADIFKRSTEYVYYLRGMELTVYSIAGEESARVGSFLVEPVFNQEVKGDKDFRYYDSAEMYLSQDCATVILILTGFDSQVGTCTMLMSLDVRDPANIVETNRVYVTGSYLSSRLVEGKLLLMSSFRIGADKDFSDESTFLPQVGVPGAMEPLAAEDILAPEKLSNTFYTVVCAIDGSTLQVKDSAAFLSYSQDVYVSENRIFASRSFDEDTPAGGIIMTEVSCLDYSGETLEFKGSVTVAGTIKDQYSMDEYEGNLRLVTTTSQWITETEGEHSWNRRVRNASLYCVDLDDFSVIASVEDFAPENESAQSVRFDGSMAYVCTAEVIQLTDPVYFFDLSDLNNITWTDTGTIDGYSSSLIHMGEGFLMGIGYGDSRQLKVEMYAKNADTVISAGVYELDADFSEEYKCYFIDRERNLVGIPVRSWHTGYYDYILLHFNGYDFHEVLRSRIDGNLEKTRAFMADGYLYIFSSGSSDQNFVVEKLH
jgi:uncharacterized secreted protein with C-terminal beta-propeller domain